MQAVFFIGIEVLKCLIIMLNWQIEPSKWWIETQNERIALLKLRMGFYGY